MFRAIRDVETTARSANDPVIIPLTVEVAAKASPTNLMAYSRLSQLARSGKPID
jgi:hypothetical protein